MVNIDELNNRIIFTIGLTTALSKTAWHLQDIPVKYWEDYNAVLALVECLQTGLNHIHSIIKEEV